MKKIILCTFLTPWLLLAQNSALDVNHYDLTIEINDSTDIIHVIEELTYSNFSTELLLPLEMKKEDGFGMTISKITRNGKATSFNHENDTIRIRLPYEKVEGDQIIIHYSGIPRNGLIIGENKFGDRTFFGDNWPERAHLWFACNDHPADKATISYSIVVPEKYSVVANGMFEGKINYDSGQSLWKFEEKHEIPTKVMVFGAAPFVIDSIPNNFPLTSYVYPQNEAAGFDDMLIAKDILNYFQSLIAPYPFDQLRNVQSTTIYGGMENAGCIFYDENAIAGELGMTTLIAHEIAHQWFGNSASEKDWEHLWLSEGFATFLTHMYVRKKEGESALIERLNSDKQRIIKFYNKYELPVKDTTSTSVEFKLNTNAYQRGSYVLYMLMNEMGEDNFWSGIKAYYTTYQYGNASTEDFFTIMQNHTDKSLQSFIEQWVYRGVLPEIELAWIAKGKKLSIEINQVQEGNPFQFPLTVRIEFTDGTYLDYSLDVQWKITQLKLNVKKDVKCIQLDPDQKILHLKAKPLRHLAD